MNIWKILFAVSFLCNVGLVIQSFETPKPSGPIPVGWTVEQVQKDGSIGHKVVRWEDLE